MTGRVSVTLIGPAKIRGRFCKPGDVVDVEPTRLAELAAAGAIASGGAQEPAGPAENVPGFDAAVADMARTLADAAVAAAVEAATEELVADRNALRTRLDDTEAELRSLQARNHELEAEISELREAAGSAPQAAEPEPTPKSPRKKATDAKG